MIKVNESQSINVSIACGMKQAYNFLSRPENFPRWASGLAGSLQEIDGSWLAETPEGKVKVHFSEKNSFGILDHWVYTQPDMPIYVPMRVVANGNGCTLIVTIFRQPDVSVETFADDAAWVLRDLTVVKNLLECGQEGPDSLV